MRPRTSTPVAGCAPSSACIASSRLPSVADRPHTTSCGFQRRSRASASCTCTPRLLPISSCHSSTITVCTRGEVARARVRASAAASAIRASSPARVRQAAGPAARVRPPACRRCAGPRVQRGASSGSGSCSARVVSAASARIGVIHSTCSAGAHWLPVRAPARPSTPRRSCRCRWWRAAGRCAPAAIAAQTSRWKSNGCQPRAANQ